MRAGAYGLSLLSDPLDVQVIQVLDRRPLSLVDLRRSVGAPAERTLRNHLRTLTERGILIRSRQPEFPGAVAFELSVSGHQLVDTASALATWLAEAPGGPIRIGSGAARSAINAIVEGWTTRVLRALAAKPLSLTELDRLLRGVNYPALERRLGAMRLVGLVVPGAGPGAGTPYKVTRWVREAVRPLARSATWERCYAPQRSEPLGRLDVEAIFLLALPLVKLPPQMAGTCCLAVELPDDPAPALAGVVVAIEHGRPVSCHSNLTAGTISSAIGSAGAWLDAFGATDDSKVELRGDRDLAAALLRALPPTRTT